MKNTKLMRLLFLTLLAATTFGAGRTQAQETSGVRSRLAAGRDRVVVTEQSDAAQAVRAVEQRPKRTRVNGYTILILSDHAQKARDTAI